MLSEYGIGQYFCRPPEKTFATENWQKRTLEIGGLAYEVEAPKSWSDTALLIAITRYFRKTGVPNTGAENSIKALVERVADTITQYGDEQKGYFANQKEADLFCDELKMLLVEQKGAFNSPVWFHCGLYHSYQISKSSGETFRWNKKTNQAILVNNFYQYPQMSACFIQNVDDDLNCIFDLLKNEARIFKFGSGSGTNFSKIRSDLETLSGGGTSSGLISFLEVFDKAAGAIKSGGSTRRAAKMVCLDIDHPEVESFIGWKWREEEKAKVLIAQGYSVGVDGEAYKTVSGQNSNNSIRIPDKFFECLSRDGSWPLIARTSGQAILDIPAKRLWKKISDAAWACGDPGVQFDSTIQKWHTCPRSGKINASNPCSEYIFLDDSACNLASLNLLAFLKQDNTFDFDAFSRAARVFFLAQNILIDSSSYPTAKIAQNSSEYRPLGLGFANLGSMLMILGIPYDSKKACAWGGLLAAIMTGEAYKLSAELAKRQGAFKHFATNKEPMLAVIKLHQKSIEKIELNLVAPKAIEHLNLLWEEVYELGAQHGFRNAQVTAIAPTGTIGMLMDCDTTGIEPEFSLVKKKQLIEGEEIFMVNRSIGRALQNLGYEENKILEILSFLRNAANHCLEGAPYLKLEHLPIFDCAQKSGRGKRYLSVGAHLNMLAAVQPFVSGAISKTINLPKDATSDDINKLYIEAWKLGLKSISIYRDQSKNLQPLTCGFDLGCAD